MWPPWAFAALSWIPGPHGHTRVSVEGDLVGNSVTPVSGGLGATHAALASLRTQRPLQPRFQPRLFEAERRCPRCRCPWRQPCRRWLCETLGHAGAPWFLGPSPGPSPSPRRGRRRVSPGGFHAYPRTRAFSFPVTSSGIYWKRRVTRALPKHKARAAAVPGGRPAGSGRSEPVRARATLPASPFSFLRGKCATGRLVCGSARRPVSVRLTWPWRSPSEADGRV